MKVKELIEKLKEHDQELEVLCYSEDEALLPKGHGFRLLEIESIDITEGQKSRNDDQVPSIKFEKSEHSQKHIMINVTSDF